MECLSFSLGHKNLLKDFKYFRRPMHASGGVFLFPIDKRAGLWYNGHIMADKGKFIVFEGTDGSGKSTQMKQLGKFLSGKGIECILTHEPTDAPFGAMLRACLTGRIEADERAIAALFAADRLDHITNTVNGIQKHLDEGITVLCDRYYFSSLAYNGGLVSADWVAQLNAPAMQLLRADLTVFIDLSPEESMKRISRRGETERYESLETLCRVRDAYFAAFERFGKEENIAVIRSEEDRDRTQANIRREVTKLFGGKL